MADQFYLSSNDRKFIRETGRLARVNQIGDIHPPSRTRRPQLGRTTTVFLGRTTTNVSGSGIFLVDNIVLVDGSDPRDDSSDPDETVTVKNTFSLSADSNTRFWCRENKSGGYEAFRPGEGSEGTTPEAFEMIADMAAGDLEGKAKLTTEFDYSLEVAGPTQRLQLRVVEEHVSGTPTSDVIIGDVVKQTQPPSFWKFNGPAGSSGLASDPNSWEELPTHQEIRVLNPNGNYTAYGAYIDCAGNGEESVAADPNANPPVEAVSGIGGFRGVGVKIVDDYDGSGFPGYLILNIEGLVPLLYVNLIYDNISEVKAEYLGISQDGIYAAGSNEQSRLPKQETFPNGGSTGEGEPAPDIEGVANVIDRHSVLELKVGGMSTLSLEPRSDVYVHVIPSGAIAGVGKLQSEITEADINGSSIIYGKGTMQIYYPTADEDRHDLAGGLIDIYTMIPEATPNGKVIQWKTINGKPFLDVEPCDSSGDS